MRAPYRRIRIRMESLVVSTRFAEGASIPTHLTANEKLTLRRLALRSKTPVVIEVGSYLGASAWFLAEGLNARSDGAALYCVDTWQNEGMSEGHRDTYSEFLANVDKHRDVIRPLRGRSDEVAAAFEVTGAGLLFIDADHSYDAAALDVRCWLPRLVDGGVVAFHDSGWAPGVQRVIEEEIRPLASEEHFQENLYWARIQNPADRVS